MNKVKKALAFSLVFLLLAVQGNGSAMAFAKNEKVIVNIKKYDYTTDINKLLDLAKQSSSHSDEKNSNLGLSIKFSVDSGTDDDTLNLEVQQLIKETTYSDGTFEREYASSSITLLEKTQYSENTSSSKYWGKYDVACTVTAYYTMFWGEETGLRLNYTTFVFNDAGSNPIYVKKVQMFSHGIYDPTSEPSIERYATYNYPSSGTIYSLNSDDYRIYGGGGFQTLFSGAIVTFSDDSMSGDYDLTIILV